MKRKEHAFVVFPSEILLKEHDLENMDGESATLIGLEMFLMDV